MGKIITRSLIELKRFLHSSEIKHFRLQRGERTTIVQRDNYHALSDFNMKHNKNGQRICLNCGKVLPDKRRRKYCSDGCVEEWLRKHYFSKMRNYIFLKQKWTCQHCGATPPLEDNGRMHKWTKDHSSLDYFDYVVDHIRPIALGGGEFDENNLQLLCGPCNKKKTREDAKKIAKKRHETKLIRLDNQFDIEGFKEIVCNVEYPKLERFYQTQLFTAVNLA